MTGSEHIEINDTTLMSYINGELLPVDNKYVQQWLEKSNENQKTFQKLKKAWEISGQVKPKPVLVDTDKAWDNVLNKISESNNSNKIVSIRAKKKNNYKYLLAVAAILALIVLTYTNLFNNKVDIVNLTASHHIIESALPDGSTITINKTSKITYPEKFSTNERRVKLEGEAFFKVKRNEKKAFIIDLPKDAYVKVLGTSFNINTNDSNNTINVTVSTGKVEFGSIDNHILLIAGEQGTLNKLTGEIKKETDAVNTIKVNLWRNEQINFDGESLNDVINMLSDIYDTKINLECDEFANNKTVITIDKNESIDEILDVLGGVHQLIIKKSQDLNNNLTYQLVCDEN